MSKQAYSVFKAIADPTRRKIIHLLIIAGTALTINQLADEFPASRQGVTKHLKILESAGVVGFRTQGREKYCFPKPESLRSVYDWVMAYENFWNNKLDALEDFLRNEEKDT